MKWTERVLEMRAINLVSETALDDAADYDRCLVGEAAHLLGRTWQNWQGRMMADYMGTEKLLDGLIGTHEIGSDFPYALRHGYLDKAERLCYAVEDAVLQLKREGGTNALP